VIGSSLEGAVGSSEDCGVAGALFGAATFFGACAGASGGAANTAAAAAQAAKAQPPRQPVLAREGAMHGRF
jgi:hypothetical protein